MENHTVQDYKISQLEKQLAEVEREFKAFKTSELEKEKKNLLWGIGLLGSVLTTVIGIVWSYRGVIFQS